MDRGQGFLVRFSTPVTINLHFHPLVCMLTTACVCVCVCVCHAQKDAVLQFPPETTIQAGYSATLHCNFSTSDPYAYIFWYQQFLTRLPEMLLCVDRSRPCVDSGRCFSQVQDAELQDNAVYLCALSPRQCLHCAALHRKACGLLWGGHPISGN
uniref:Ig-like domain-containing protein n=1 Tax=Dromaius novaehollandiae TaxID=8790 RepID=A0A8C4JAT8_DRONO